MHVEVELATIWREISWSAIWLSRELCFFLMSRGCDSWNGFPSDWLTFEGDFQHGPLMCTFHFCPKREVESGPLHDRSHFRASELSLLPNLASHTHMPIELFFFNMILPVSRESVLFYFFLFFLRFFFSLGVCHRRI